MKRIIISLISLTFILSVTTACLQNAKKVNVTYVGNAGFLYEVGGKKILIDALFKGFEGGYLLPQDIQEKLMKAEAPFNDVDLILVTHAHGDHVNLSMINEHMKNNPKAIFATTKQLAEHMKDTTGRILGFNPTKEKPDAKEIQGIRVESYLLPHGQDYPIINNGYLIFVDGIKLFQTGDADFSQFSKEEFSAFKLREKNIDLVMIQHYYMRGDSISDYFINNQIGGKHLFPIHYQFTTPAYDADTVKKYYPEAILFSKELESKEIILDN